ncbi:hypothetical protein CGRA01v4_04563 [Colletotrichum graminicola]|nr:hypothetical protein CGRA01v4_04563 [Colletotrichum graminicola]
MLVDRVILGTASLCIRKAQDTRRLMGFGAAYREKPLGGVVWVSAWSVDGTSS